MEFRLLGPLELEGEQGIVPLGSGKQRALLAVLVLNANERISRERLIDELWGEAPPPSAAHSVDVYVSRLRKTLTVAGADGALRTRGDGYELHLDGQESDVKRFERLVDEARRSDPERAATLLRVAAGLWRGPPLADVDLPGSARAAVDRLEELRLVALEERIEADLTLGRHAALVGELRGLVSEHPLRERLRAQQMRALYGAGRQAEALDAYTDARRALAELGLEPSPELKDLQRQVLTHDRSLRPVERQPAESRRRVRRRWAPMLAGAVILVAATGLALGLIRRSGSSTPALTASYNSVGLFDTAKERLVADIPIGGSPTLPAVHGTPTIAAGLGSIWVLNADDRTLLRIDPRTRKVVRTIGLSATPAAVAVGHGAVWVEPTPSTYLIELDALGNVVRRIPLPRPKSALEVNDGPLSLASGPHAIWVLHALAHITKIDPRTGRVLHDTPNLGGVLPGQIIATRDAVWLTGLDQGRLVRLDPATGTVVATTPAAGGVNHFWRALATGPGGIWVTDPEDALTSLVWRVDPLSNRTDGSVSVDIGASGIAVRGGSVWVAASTGMIDRVDPDTMQVVGRAKVGSNPVDLVSGPGGLWATFGSPT